MANRPISLKNLEKAPALGVDSLRIEKLANSNQAIWRWVKPELRHHIEVSINISAIFRSLAKTNRLIRARPDWQNRYAQKLLEHNQSH